MIMLCKTCQKCKGSGSIRRPGSWGIDACPDCAKEAEEKYQLEKSDKK